MKDNHKSIRKGVSEALGNELLVETYGDIYTTDEELGHGRIEERTVVALPVDVIPNRQAFKDWKKVYRNIMFL